MKDDEIKKIVEEIECYQNEDTCILVLSQQENNALLNYITNLEDYKSRNEKAIKHIKEEIADIEFMKKEYKKYYSMDVIEVKLKNIEELNNILRGDE